MKTIEFKSVQPRIDFGSQVNEVFRSIVLKKLKLLNYGHLLIHDLTSGESHAFGDSSSPIVAHLNVKNTDFYRRIAIEGSVGAGESYSQGDWDCDELPSLVRIFSRNMNVVQGIDSGFGALFNPALKLGHWFRRNTRAGARKNIYAHYDLGNDYFKLILDPSMMYSCAVFEKDESSLEEASRLKIDIICRKLKLKASDHLLEIGTGWGSFALAAAKNYGCRVTTTTISNAQYEYAREQVAKAGLESQVTVLLEDYRDLSGKFDKLVSIEMIEAVGLDHLDTYFSKCSQLLKETGRMILQAIIIRDQQYEYAKANVDFIKKCIFPGSGIPSVKSIVDAVAKNTEMRLFNQSDYSEDYAKTLRHWSKNMNTHRDEIRDLGYPEELFRLWQFYFAYCEGGFMERNIGLVQMEFQKPLAR